MIAVVSIRAGPRSAGRDTAAPDPWWVRVVSIRAPRAGRDPGRRSDRFPCQMFRSARPVRGATICRPGLSQAHWFRSARPVRGATRRGCSRACGPSCFDPRAPCGARRDAAWLRDYERRVSIRAPRAGRDYLWHSRYFCHLVSIRAPRAGRDYRRGGAARHRGCFDPRAPCGARPPPQLRRPACRSFDPRAPCGARQQRPRTRPLRPMFRSARPVRGATDGD